MSSFVLSVQHVQSYLYGVLLPFSGSLNDRMLALSSLNIRSPSAD